MGAPLLRYTKLPILKTSNMSNIVKINSQNKRLFHEHYKMLSHLIRLSSVDKDLTIEGIYIKHDKVSANELVSVLKVFNTAYTIRTFQDNGQVSLELMV